MNGFWKFLEVWGVAQRQKWFALVLEEVYAVPALLVYYASARQIDAAETLCFSIVRPGVLPLFYFRAGTD